MAHSETASKKGPEDLTCFVVIGFGTKTDYATGRVLDLDLTYRKLIKPAFDRVGVNCFRAIDVNVSGSIDTLMYKWIYHADFVVADLSTMNANVFYELGVRHAQRPNTTLIMAENGILSKLPFDLSHTIIYGYEHQGESISDAETERFVSLLAAQLEKLVATPIENDSPVYTYMPGMAPPTWTDPIELIKELKAKLANRDRDAESDAAPDELKEQPLSVLAERAEKSKKQGDFTTARVLFEMAAENNPDDLHLKQRLALVTYKEKENDPDDDVAIAALRKAEHILKIDCDLAHSNDPETLGLSGAVYKRMHERSGDMTFFDKSIECYERGFYVKQDYYNGINVAFMYTVKANVVENKFDAVVNYGHANIIRRKVAEICRELIDSKEFATRADRTWVYQTLAQAYLGLGQLDRVTVLLPEIEAMSEGTFDMSTFVDQNEKLIAAISEFKNKYSDMLPPDA